MEKRRVHWVAWENIYRERELGGMGIKNLRDFNLALLWKWRWRMKVDKESLWYRVLAARYG